MSDQETWAIPTYGPFATEEDPITPTFVAQENTPLLSEIEYVPQPWLWQDFLPANKLVTVFGEQGNGKSTFMAHLAAIVSRGWNWPDGTLGVEGGAGVVYIDLEDDTESISKKRLIEAGADESRILPLAKVHVSSTDRGEPTEVEFAIPDHLPQLEAAIVKVEAKLVTINPLMRIGGKGVHINWNENVQKNVIRPLEDLANRTGVCIILVGHTTKSRNKNTTIAAQGTKALTDGPRICLSWETDPSDFKLRILRQFKNNLADIRDNLTFERRLLLDKAGHPVFFDGQPIRRLECTAGHAPSVQAVIKAQQLSSARQRILSLLESADRFFNASTVAQQVRIPLNTTAQHLNRMEKDGQIAKTARGNYCSLAYAKEYIKTLQSEVATTNLVPLPEDTKTVALNGNTVHV